MQGASHTKFTSLNWRYESATKCIGAGSSRKSMRGMHVTRMAHAFPLWEQHDTQYIFHALFANGREMIRNRENDAPN